MIIIMGFVWRGSQPCILPSIQPHLLINRFQPLEYKGIAFDGHELTHPTMIYPQTNNYAQIVRLKHKDSRSELLVSNTHLYWRPEASFVKLRQVFVLMKELHLMINGFEDAIVMAGGKTSIHCVLSPLNLRF